MSFPYSVSLICPAEVRDGINALAQTLGHGHGHGPGTMTVAMSADGSEPATHYGAHTWAQQSFIDILAAGQQGNIPLELETAGYTGAQVADLLSNLRYAVHTEGRPRENFDALAAEVGVQRIIVDDRLV